MSYRPKEPFTVPMLLLVPIWENINGVRKKVYPNSFDKGLIIYGSFKTFGGTEVKENNLYTVKDTAIIETWYTPDIKTDCMIKVLSSGELYEVIGTPENINMRNQFLKFKVERTKGKS